MVEANQEINDRDDTSGDSWKKGMREKAASSGVSKQANNVGAKSLGAKVQLRVFMHRE